MECFSQIETIGATKVVASRVDGIEERIEELENKPKFVSDTLFFTLSSFIFEISVLLLTAEGLQHCELLSLREEWLQNCSDCRKHRVFAVLFLGLTINVLGLANRNTIPSTPRPTRAATRRLLARQLFVASPLRSTISRNAFKPCSRIKLDAGAITSLPTFY
jgi:hypothetical protein